MDPAAGSAKVGICIPEPEYWGCGHGTEALRLLLDHLFGQLALREVRVDAWTGNRRMMRVAEKCGFTAIGTSPHRSEYSVRGEPLEFIHFDSCRSEWYQGHWFLGSALTLMGIVFLHRREVFWHRWEVFLCRWEAFWR
jgi:RimJ/RimL family protein N-acetyltransferase